MWHPVPKHPALHQNLLGKECTAHNTLACVVHICNMAAGPVRLVVNSPINTENVSAFCNSDCICCAIMKSEVEALDKEVKSLTEIINILSEDLQVNCANKEAS